MPWLALRAVGCNDKGTTGTIFSFSNGPGVYCGKVHHQLHKADFEFVRIFKWDADSSVMVDCKARRNKTSYFTSSLPCSCATSSKVSSGTVTVPAQVLGMVGTRERASAFALEDLVDI